MIMDVEQTRHIRSSSELNVGDQIEAWHNGKLFHRGTVTQTVAAMDLFWILDSRTGTRRLIDAEALVILRAAEPGTAEAATRAPARPPAQSPHMPLFQAPSLSG
jgi:hypothetical protein